MGRPRSGTLRRHQTKQGISYGVAFSYRNQQVYVHLGGEWDGWDDKRAAEEQRFLMEKVNRGEWTPAKAEPALGVATAASPSFQVEASEWLHRRKVGPATEGAQRRFATSSGASRLSSTSSAPCPSRTSILALPTSSSSNLRGRGI